jgi:tRNA pseudouridine32 synthase / 23S rRNA pseudouridine746 synthase
MDLEIIYQDEYLVAINKPCGMLSVPGRGADKQDCVVTRLLPDNPEIKVVHRLDCHTSGVMLLALGADMQRALSRQFHDREVTKSYIALVHGVVAQRSGVIDIPMRGDPSNRPRQVIDYVNGKHAQTQWCLLGYEHTATMMAASRLQLRPVTGRTHQLRVHCMALGHPVIGDRLYCAEGVVDTERMMLHAERLEFLHPVHHARMRLVAACEF